MNETTAIGLPRPKLSRPVPKRVLGRPDFIPHSLWFAFLLRSDARLERPTTDVEAMRDFCCWWLVTGHLEYPCVWGVTTEIVSIAMEDVPTHGGPMPRLLWFLWRVRPDLQRAFPLYGTESVYEFFCWYRIVARGQFGYAPTLPQQLIAETELQSGKIPEQPFVPRMALAMLNLAENLKRLLDLNNPIHRGKLTEIYRQNAPHLAGVAQQIPPPPLLPRPKLTEFPDGQIGINLVGFAKSEFGLGEDVRMFSRVLEAADIPHVIVDIADDSASVARRQDETLAGKIVDAPVYPLTVLCMSPFDAATLWLRRGHEIFDDRYLVGYWVWELERLPDQWHEVAKLVDEIWAPSQYTANSFLAQKFRPVRYLPPLVELPPFRKLSRKSLGLPLKPFLFIYPFDPNSFLARKNPYAVIQAFKLAFPPEAKNADRTRLVLRVNGKPDGADWRSVLDEVADDKRILIIEGTMDRSRALAMMAACDCLVSLHRAEGFGRNIAEAKLLGIKVIATGYSGCVDFLAAEECVGFRLVPVGDGYPFGAGMKWAEADIDVAAGKMLMQSSAHDSPHFDVR